MTEYEKLKTTGHVSKVVNDRRFHMFMNHMCGIDQPGVLIVAERGGAVFYEFNRPLTIMWLLSQGFDIIMATLVAHWVDEVLMAHIDEGQTPKLE